jgi:hypothetical protein
MVSAKMEVVYAHLLYRSVNLSFVILNRSVGQVNEGEESAGVVGFVVSSPLPPPEGDMLAHMLAYSNKKARTLYPGF